MPKDLTQTFYLKLESVRDPVPASEASIAALKELLQIDAGSTDTKQLAVVAFLYIYSCIFLNKRCVTLAFNSIGFIGLKFSIWDFDMTSETKKKKKEHELISLSVSMTKMEEKGDDKVS